MEQKSTFTNNNYKTKDATKDEKKIYCEYFYTVFAQKNDTQTT